MSSPTTIRDRHSEEIDQINAAHREKLEKLQSEIDSLNSPGRSSVISAKTNDATNVPAAAVATTGSPHPKVCSKAGFLLGVLLVANVATVILCVGFNKVLYNFPYNFKFASSLMCFHFIFTFSFVQMAKLLKWYTPKKAASELVYVKLGAAQAGAVGFINMSLFYNTIGMYQVFKFTNVLVICLIEFLWKKKSYSMGIYASLATLTCGVLMATVSNVELTMKGAFFGVCGSLCTAIYQISNKAAQVEHDLKPLQLMEHEQPYTILWTMAFALFTDDIKALFTFIYTPKIVLLLFASGFFAFGVNVTSYMIIGKFGPVTYGVLGHSKAVGVMLFGFMMLHEVPSMNTATGMLIAFFAIVVYTHLSSASAAAQPKIQPSSPPAEVVDQRNGLLEGDEKK